MRVARTLGISEEELIPVSLKMHAANNQGITILGAAPLRFSGSNPNGEKVETRQLTYITDTTDTLFLSREACSALGIIAKGFPSVGAASCPASTQPNGPACDYNDTESCNCPQRKSPPPIPMKLPYPPTDENREKLQEYLVNYYRASAFNTCKRQ
jgi:hypothetical protein